MLIFTLVEIMFAMVLQTLNQIITIQFCAVYLQIFDALFGNPRKSHTATFLILLLHPGQKGSVKLASTNPLDPPLIDHNFLADPQDIRILTEGV